MRIKMICNTTTNSNTKNTKASNKKTKSECRISSASRWRYCLLVVLLGLHRSSAFQQPIFATSTSGRISNKSTIHSNSINRNAISISPLSLSRIIVHPNKNTNTNTNTALYGIDFDAISEDEECDFLTPDGEFISEIDFSKCPLPSPNADIVNGEDVVHICMEALLSNNEPRVDAGLEICFNFSSDRCRAVNGGSLEQFVNFASNPTFQSMVNAREWKTLSVGPIIPAGPTRGAMKTVLISVIPRDTNLKERKFLWTLQQERRPPKQGLWLVHECIAVDNTFATTL